MKGLFDHRTWLSSTCLDVELMQHHHDNALAKTNPAEAGLSTLASSSLVDTSQLAGRRKVNVQDLLMECCKIKAPVKWAFIHRGAYFESRC